jgi:hypothetical protein
MTPQFTPLPTAIVRVLQAGGPDAHGQPPEIRVSDGDGNPCRHCLRMIPAGAGMIVLAHMPFPVLQPYAETGPIFLCADACAPGGGETLPEILASPDYNLRGYDADHRIVYGTGGIVRREAIMARAADLLADPGIAYLHVRSARNGCYQLRIDRGGDQFSS